MIPQKRSRRTIHDYLPQILPWLLIAIIAVFFIRLSDRPIEVFASEDALQRFKIETGIPQSHEIILLVTEWCPACKALQSSLRERGVPFSVLDVEADAQGSRLYSTCISRGAPHSVPKVIYNREMVSQSDLFKLLLLKRSAD